MTIYRFSFVVLTLALMNWGAWSEANGSPAALQDANAKPAEKSAEKAVEQSGANSAESAAKPAQVEVPPAEDLSHLTYRRLEPRADTTIFSPLRLPDPSRMRTAAGLPGEDYWQQQADYKIEAALDDAKDAISATEHVTYTNNSPHELPYLWIYLEQNLFRDGSDGSKFTPPGSRFNNRTEFVGGVDVEYVRCGSTDVPIRIYDTVARIDLPKPVAARGGKVEFEIAWRFNIPQYGVDRMGIRKVKRGKIYEIAQWFPCMCKFDDVHGWNTAPYLGQGEFYGEFGAYDVKITAPSGHVVCATGELKNPDEVLSDAEMRLWKLARGSRSTVVIRSEEDLDKQAENDASTKTWHFVADKVRSFAWTSSKATIWDAASIDWGDGTSTLVQSVYPGEARGAWVESTQMLRHSILNYSEMWFRYPYPCATNVNGIVGGMEYPMIIFCGGDTDKRGLHGVTSHEIGHNWFPMTVNTDERRYAWMDEGFNTFINAYDRFEDYDAAVNEAEHKEIARPFSARSFGRVFGSDRLQPIDLPADQVRPELLGVLEYSKTGVAMRMLREVVLGPERFDPAFKEYIKAWAFKSPQPADFYRCMENGTGMDLSWFWRGWFIENLKHDQAVVSVAASERSSRATISLANKQEMVMPVKLRVDFDDDTSIDHTLPVYVWYYSNLWTTEVETHGKKIKRVTIDPDRQLPDANRLDNVWKAPAIGAEANKAEGEAKETDGE